MSKFKTILAISIIAVIISVCAIAASAALSCTTEVYWNVDETAAYSQTIGMGPTDRSFTVKSWIESTSTGIYSSAFADSHGSPSATATTSWVPVTYPSDIPLVTYGGEIYYE